VRPGLSRALVLLAAAAFFYRLGAVALLGPDEPSYAEVAREMVERGDWVTPYLMGRPWLDKPPALFWAQSASLRTLGEGEIAARLPSALAAVGTCALVFWLGRRLFGPAAGVTSALILATTLGLAVYGRAAIPDALLTFTLTLGLASYFLHSRGQGASGPLALAFASFAAAVLAKGPVGLVLPLLLIAVFHLATTPPREIRLRAAALGIAALAFVAVAAPWHLAVWRAQGWAFVEEFLLQHNLDRYLSTVHRHPGPIYYYLPVLLVALFPWSVFVPAAAARALRRADPPRRYLLLWVAVPFVFFSLAGSKLPGYLLPVLPPAALLLGDYLTGEGKPSPRALAAHALLALALAGAILYFFAGHRTLELEDGLPLALALAATGVAAAWVSRQRPGKTVASFAAGSLLVTLVLLHDSALRLEPHYSLKTLALAARSRMAPGEKLVCYKSFYREALFYSHGRLEDIWTLEEISIRVAERGRMLVLGERWRYEELALAPALQVEFLQEVEGRVLAELKPREATPLE
jgi:4-amino-4-deoxy-L-arabinose transferase-like glycosyltransferase